MKVTDFPGDGSHRQPRRTNLELPKFCLPGTLRDQRAHFFGARHPDLDRTPAVDDPMSIHKRVVVSCFALATGWLVLSCGDPHDVVEKLEPVAVSSPDYHKDRGDATAQALADALTVSAVKDRSDFLDLGLANIQLGQIERAVESFEAAARLSSTPAELAACLHLKAVGLIMKAGETEVGYPWLQWALESSELAVACAPDAAPIVDLRRFLGLATDDSLSVLAAERHLRSIDANLVGEPVAIPVAVYLAGAQVLIHLIDRAVDLIILFSLPPEERRDFARMMAAESKAILNPAAALQALSVGQNFLKRSGGGK